MTPTLFLSLFLAQMFNGSPAFKVEGNGEFIVEISVQLVARTDADLILESNGRVLDGKLKADRLRLYPGSKRLRVWNLTGVARGGEELTLRSTYPEFRLVEKRFTPREEFERDIAPKLAERLERMGADPFFEGRKQSRAALLRQMGELARWSSQPAIRRAGLLGAIRGTYWLAAENHEPRDVRLLGELMDEALKEMPDHPLIRQMASASCSGLNTGAGRGMACTESMRRVQAVPWETVDSTNLRGAPAWAAAQWTMRARMEDITRYWVRDRQRPNGEIAGGWGDDVEILRQWGPLAMGLGSAEAEEGLRRIALGVWDSGILKDGYNAQIEDVEHSAEPSSDTLPLLAAIAPFDPDARRKLAIAAACADNWIARQPDGFWRFKSSWFNCSQHDPAPERAVDVHLNARAMGPAVWHAWLSRDPRLIGLLENWGQSWLAAMRSTADGKPAGMIPAAMRSADGKYLLGSSWDKPDVEWDYFQWTRGSQESIAHLFLALGELTGKTSWRAAAGEAFRGVQLSIPELNPVEAEEPLLRKLAGEMEQTAARLSTNFDMHTREAIYTDRVYYALPAAVTPYLFGGAVPRGDRAPGFAVTWPASASRFARVVVEASSSRFVALLYGFEEAGGVAKVRLWRLKPGAYRWSAGGRTGNLNVERVPSDLDVPLAARKQIRLIVEPAAR